MKGAKGGMRWSNRAQTKTTGCIAKVGSAACGSNPPFMGLVQDKMRLNFG
jgi:hypothetical protein